MGQIAGDFEGQVEGFELYPVDSGELLKVFGQGWGDLLGAMLRNHDQMSEWGESS